MSSTLSFSQWLKHFIFPFFSLIIHKSLSAILVAVWLCDSIFLSSSPPFVFLQRTFIIITLKPFCICLHISTKTFYIPVTGNGCPCLSLIIVHCRPCIAFHNFHGDSISLFLSHTSCKNRQLLFNVGSLFLSIFLSLSLSLSNSLAVLICANFYNCLCMLCYLIWSECIQRMFFLGVNVFF